MFIAHYRRRRYQRFTAAAPGIEYNEYDSEENSYLLYARTNVSPSQLSKVPLLVTDTRVSCRTVALLSTRLCPVTPVRSPLTRMSHISQPINGAYSPAHEEASQAIGVGRRCHLNRSKSLQSGSPHTLPRSPELQ